MKAEIEASGFADALKTAAGLTRGNSHLMAHGCILIEADSDGICVTGGNGESYVRVPAGGNVRADGAVLVPAKTVAKAVALMDGVVTLSVDIDGALGIDTMTSRFTLPAAPVDDYPKIAWPAPDADMFDLTEAWGDLALITYAADGHEARHRSITFHANGVAECYGGTRVAHCPIPEGITAQVYRSTMEYAVKTFEDTTVLLHAGRNGLTFLGAGIRLWTTMPQYDLNPLPLNFETEHAVTVDRKALLEGFRLMEVVKEGDEVPIRIDVKNGELHLNASSVGQGFSSTAIPTEGDLPWPTGLSLGHARDAISRCKAETVTLNFSPQPNRPIRLVDGKVTHILNPNRKAVESVQVDL